MNTSTQIALYRKVRLFRFTLVILCFGFNVVLFAQNPITPISARYINPDQYDSYMQRAFLSVLSENHVPLDEAKVRYGKQRQRLWDAAYPMILKEFKSVEYYYHTSIHASKGTSGFEKVKNQYEKAIYQSLRNAIHQYPSFQKQLNFNLSDRITNFKSEIEIQQNGLYRVTETIVIFNGDGESNLRYSDAGNEEWQNNTNNLIKRGIVRTFPTIYIGNYGFETHTTFKVKYVKRNGKSEAYHLKKHKNGFQLFLGSSDVLLEDGTHIYEIGYESDRQLFRGQDFDECNWNVTGNGWDFVIEEASCILKIPGKGNYLSEKCYTGYQDSTQNDCISYYDSSSGSLTYKTTRLLKPNEGLTIAVSFPKGVIEANSGFRRLFWFVGDNLIVFLFPLAMTLTILVNFILWWFFGRDKLEEVAFPQFQPPAGYSPAALGFIQDQRFSDKLVAATLLDYGVNGYIHIDVSKTVGFFKKDAYHFRVNSDESSVKTDYQNFMDEVGMPSNTVLVKGDYNPIMVKFSNDLSNYCERNYIQPKRTISGLFSLNNRFLAFGNLLGLGTGIWVFILLAKSDPPNPWLWLYAFLGMVLFIITQNKFYKVMPAYNEKGRKLMQSIRGFVMYLKAAEEIVINAMNPPEKTPDLYEKYLPFAVALGCESEWAEQFRDVLETALIQDNYKSSWYRSSSSSSMTSGFGGSLSGSISSASSPSSSGSSGGSSFGGGSSGGGGGGGGGSGW